jgi:hypothetical protein
MQRERIAAIERGLDPDKIASMQRPLLYDDHGIYTDPHMQAERRRQGLMIGGIVTLFAGVAVASSSTAWPAGTTAMTSRCGWWA